jgi:hypothetical protein
MNEHLSHYLTGASFILQTFGFVFISLAWWKALQELVRGRFFYRTRVIMFVVTTVALLAYIVPTALALCYFAPGCFQPVYRDYLRLFSGLIFFLYGLFKFLLYYTKEANPLGRQGGV